jgi:hypothetical protein
MSKREQCGIRRILPPASAAMFLLWSTTALADSGQNDALTFFQQNRTEALTNALLQSSSPALFGSGLVFGDGSSETSTAPSTDFKVTLLAPFAYDSNINAVDQNSTGGYHGTPALQVEGTVTFKFLKLDGALDASSDRFVDHPEVDSDSAGGAFQAILGDMADDQGFRFIGAYDPAFGFSPTFAARRITENTFTAGVVKAFAFDDQWVRLPSRKDSINNSTYSFAFGVSGGRAVSTGLSSDFVGASASFNYQINFDWALQVQVAPSRPITIHNRAFTREIFLSRPT